MDGNEAKKNTPQSYTYVVARPNRKRMKVCVWGDETGGVFLNDRTKGMNVCTMREGCLAKRKGVPEGWGMEHGKKQRVRTCFEREECQWERGNKL